MTALTKIATATRRVEATLLQDALGMAAIAIMLLVGLHLPVLL